jgi:hypothetical protein
VRAAAVLGKLMFLTNVCLFFAPTLVAQAQQRPMTVCEFMQQIKKLDGHIVSVRGLLVLNESDLRGATPDYLTAQCPGFKRSRVEIKINYPDTWFLEKPPKGYHVDAASFRRAYRVIKATLKNGNVTDRWIATIVGQVSSVGPWPPPPPNEHVTLEDHGDAEIVIAGIYDLEGPPSHDI